ncbi:MAG: OB-fold nucleic acid binding domain-containing protein, partial [Candidatus Sulfotelmatobacter sp.]
ATIVKDAQRHGLKMLPVDVTCSEWRCTLESAPSTQYPVPSKTLVIPTPERTREAEESRNSVLGTGYSQLAPALRLGLRYVRGLREEGAQALVRARSLASFASIHDLTRRVPELRKDELTTLAEIGALNAVASPESRVASRIFVVPDLELSQEKTFVIPTPERKRGAEESRNSQLATGYSKLHRRDALWQVERAVRGSGPLLENLPEPDVPSPLQPMNHEERLVADFHGTGLTVGPHPMAYRRDWLNAMGIRRASELRDIPNGKRLRIGGCVITRQRPGTAKGFVFVSLEDETGVANAIITPDLFHRNRLLLTSERFLAIEGILQNLDNVISVKAERVQPLFVTKAETASHDFH